MMNNRGAMGFSIVIGIMIFLIGIPIINILKPEIDVARGSSGLDCSNVSISDGTRLTCLGVDLVIPYFILIVLSVAGGFIAERFLL
jgi:hypothetical protein